MSKKKKSQWIYYTKSDGTNGIAVKVITKKDSITQKIKCLDCDAKLKIHLFPDENYPTIEINGVLIGYSLFRILFLQLMDDVYMLKRNKNA